MSRRYRVEMLESVSRVVCADDGLEIPLDAIPVLPQKRMGEILAAELQRRGFERDGETMRRSQDGVDIVIDLNESKASIKSRKKEEVEAVLSKKGWVEEEHAASNEKRMREGLRRDLQKKLNEEEKRVQEETTKHLEERLPGIAAELDAAIGVTTSEALKEKARQLGEIKEMSEDSDSLTIKVRV